MLGRVSASLHDGLSQELAAGLIQIRILQERLLAGGQLGGEDFEGLTDVLQKVVRSMRGLGRRLQPLGRGPEGLMEALARLAEETSARVPCRFICEEPVLCCDADRALLLIRVAEEAIDVALRRTERQQIVLTLKAGEGSIAVLIEDFGADPGGNPAEEAQKYGVSRHRAKLWGAEWQIDTNSRGGVRITCRLPSP